MNQDMSKPILPWWRVPTMWLVIGGPTLVVVACIVTLVIAMRHADVPLRDASTHQADTMTPAKQARNHAAASRR